VPDRSISAHARVKCCKQFWDLEKLKGEKVPDLEDPPRWDYRCPTCKKVLVYGCIVMGLYAKAGVGVERYKH